MRVDACEQDVYKLLLVCDSNPKLRIPIATRVSQTERMHKGYPNRRCRKQAKKSLWMLPHSKFVVTKRAFDALTVSLDREPCSAQSPYVRGTNVWYCRAPCAAQQALNSYSWYDHCKSCCCASEPRCCRCPSCDAYCAPACKWRRRVVRESDSESETTNASTVTSDFTSQA